MSAPDINSYKAAPTRAAALAFFKEEQFRVPENMRIVGDDEFSWDDLCSYTDEPYFKLYHDLKNIKSPRIPADFCLFDGGADDYYEHILRCYPDISITKDTVIAYKNSPQYDEGLFIMLKERLTGDTAASGIALIDRRIGEGVLDWIQVSPEYRRRGLGKFVVLTLLSRLKGSAEFATVSGRLNDENNPMRLYENCGFTNAYIWHILTKNA